MKIKIISIKFLFLILFFAAHFQTVYAEAPSLQSKESKGRVIVVGGGVSGLVTAYELEKQGISVELLEAGVRFGGRVGTAHYGSGLYAEYGLQEIWEHNPLLKIVNELCLETEMVDDPFSSVLMNNKLYPYVQDSREEYFKSIFNEKEHAFLKQLITKMEKVYLEAEKGKLTGHLKKLQAISFSQWLADNKTPSKVKEFMELELEVELGTHADRFSALSGIIESKIFLFGGEKFYHLKGGNYLLVEAIASRIKGGKHLGARVTKVERKMGPAGRLVAEVSYIQNGTELKKVYGDAVVVSVPWVWLHFIQFDPPLTPLQLKGINSLGRGQYTVLHLIMSKDAEKLWSIDGKTPFVVLSNTPMGAIYGPSDSKGETDKLVFSLLVYGDEARAWHLAPHEAKRNQVVGELEKLWPGFSKYVVDSSTYTYHPSSVAFWPIGRSQIDEMSQSLRKPSNGLFLVGDYLYGSHSHAAAQSAVDVVSKILKFLSNPVEVR